MPRPAAESPGRALEPLVVYRRRRPPLVAAAQQPDGSYLVLAQDGAGEERVTAAVFAQLYEPATLADVRAIAVPGPVPIQLPPARAEAPPRPRRKPGRRGKARKPVPPVPVRRRKPGRQAEVENSETDAWDRVRALWDEGAMSVPKIVQLVRRVGTTPLTANMIYSRANYYKWPPKRRAKAAQGKKAAAGSSAVVTPQRRWDSCQQMTPTDPCSICQAPWKRDR